MRLCKLCAALLPILFMCRLVVGSNQYNSGNKIICQRKENFKSTVYTQISDSETLKNDKYNSLLRKWRAPVLRTHTTVPPVYPPINENDPMAIYYEPSRITHNIFNQPRVVMESLLVPTYCFYPQDFTKARANPPPQASTGGNINQTIYRDNKMNASKLSETNGINDSFSNVKLFLDMYVRNTTNAVASIPSFDVDRVHKIVLECIKLQQKLIKLQSSRGSYGYKNSTFTKSNAAKSETNNRDDLISQIKLKCAEPNKIMEDDFKNLMSARIKNKVIREHSTNIAKSVKEESEKRIIQPQTSRQLTTPSKDTKTKILNAEVEENLNTNSKEITPGMDEMIQEGLFKSASPSYTSIPSTAYEYDTTDSPRVEAYFTETNTNYLTSTVPNIPEDINVSTLPSEIKKRQTSEQSLQKEVNMSTVPLSSKDYVTTLPSISLFTKFTMDKNEFIKQYNKTYTKDENKKRSNIFTTESMEVAVPTSSSFLLSQEPPTMIKNNLSKVQSDRNHTANGKRYKKAGKIPLVPEIVVPPTFASRSIYPKTEILIPKIETHELVNGSVLTSMKGFENISIDDDNETENYNVTTPLPEIITQSNKTKFTILTGRIFFVKDNDMIPLQLIQDKDGKIDLSVDSNYLCDRLLEGSKKSIMLSVLCKST